MTPGIRATRSQLKLSHQVQLYLVRTAEDVFQKIRIYYSSKKKWINGSYLIKQIQMYLNVILRIQLYCINKRGNIDLIRN